MINHVADLYGRDSVCQIITFRDPGLPRRNQGRWDGHLEVPYAEVERIAKMIPPPVRGRNVSASAQALEQVPELKNVKLRPIPALRRLMEIAQRLEGCARHSSVHAAGVVISPFRSRN